MQKVLLLIFIAIQGPSCSTSRSNNTKDKVPDSNPVKSDVLSPEIQKLDTFITDET